MLKNDNRILKNGDKIFKSQVVNSYLELNSNLQHWLYVGVSGLTASKPLKIYYSTPTQVIKNTVTTDSSLYTIGYAATNETSYKPWYFHGNLNSVYSVTFNNASNRYGSTYRGDLLGLMGQFPNIRTFRFLNATSIFNKNLTNETFPPTLKTFQIGDSTLSGQINTIKNFTTIEDLTLYDVLFTNNLTDLNFNNLNKLDLYNLTTLRGNINDLINKNPNFYYFDFWNCPLWSGNTTTLDTSKLTYIHWYCANTPAITGTIDNWTFNTGLTTLSIIGGNYSGNITNWDFSNTKVTSISISNYNTKYTCSGSLSGWTLPSTLTLFKLYRLTGVTSMPHDFSKSPSNLLVDIQYCNSLNDDINSINFGRAVSIYFYQCSKMYGNLNNFAIPSGCTLFHSEYSKLTGNIREIITGGTLNNVVTSLYLTSNYITGELQGITIPSTITDMRFGGNTGITLTLGSFNTNNLNILYLDNIGSITGNLANFTIANNMGYLGMNSNSGFSADLSKLNISKVYDFRAFSCPYLYGDLTNWYITGTTRLSYLQIHDCPLLSGNTTNWSVNNLYDLRINNTALSGVLKHNDIHTLFAQHTKISSNIATDFNFSNRGYQIQLQNSNIQGNLSGVTLHYNVYQFYVTNCSGITGANAFVNYIFVNRKNWTYVNPYFQFSNIGDNVTGTSETLGSLGTWTGSQWDLTEEQANNLVAGTDYDGAGTNTPWDSKQKIYWMKNALVSSTNPTKRYKNFQILYS